MCSEGLDSQGGNSNERSNVLFRRFTEERCTFLDYKDIQEYIEDIVVCLVYSSWHYSEERGPENCVRKVWNGLRSISSKKSLLMMHVRKLVIAAVKEVGMEPVEIKWGYSGIHEVTIHGV